MCSALRSGLRGFGRGFTCPGLLGIRLGGCWLRLRGSHPVPPAFPGRSPAPAPLPRRRPATPGGRPPGLGTRAFARRYLRVRCRLLFLRVLRCFTSPGFAPPPYVFRRGSPASRPAGFPHSDTRGSRAACASPRIFAACCVLRRHTVPRHPSRARIRLAARALGALRPVSSFGCVATYAPLANFQTVRAVKDRTLLRGGGRWAAQPWPGKTVLPGRRWPAWPPRPAGRRDGGRAWGRTRDLVLIRDAL